MSPRRFKILLLLAAVLAAIAMGKYFVAGSPRDAAPGTLESGTLLSPARPLPAFALVDQNGAAAGPESFKGHWTLVYFGFTHCPEACPATLALLAQLKRELAGTLPPAQLPSVLLVSVDPERDSPAVLKSYLASFDPEFRGFTGTPEALRDFAAGLGMLFWKVPNNRDYLMEHGTAILLVDQDGQLAALFSAPHVLDALVRDYRRSVGASESTLVNSQVIS